MLKESGIDPRWDDGLNNKGIDMKFIEAIIITLVILIFVAMGFEKLVKLQEEKTALEIKVLQHELKAYEDMDKELAE